MKERPILFSGPMVRSILEGRKTQTRMVVKPQPEKSPVRTYKWKWTPKANNSVSWNGPVRIDCPHCSFWTKYCPHGTVGDRLWVREAFCQKFEDSGFVYNHEGNLDSTCCLYKADGVHVVCVDGDGFTKFNKDGTESSPWTPSIHMPRWASRITLEITAVRVERLQEISDADCRAEGCCHRGWDVTAWKHPHNECGWNIERANFASLWSSINGPESWSANPWVWVIEFKRLETA